MNTATEIHFAFTRGISATSVQTYVFTVSSLPRGSGEPPRASALWGLTDLLLPAGVYVFFLR